MGHNKDSSLTEFKRKIRINKSSDAKAIAHHLPQTDQSPASLNNVYFGKIALWFYC